MSSSLSTVSLDDARVGRRANVVEYLAITAMLLVAVAWAMYALGLPYRWALLDPVRMPIIIFFGPLVTVALGLILAAAVFVQGSFRHYLPATVLVIKRLLELGILFWLCQIHLSFAEWGEMSALPRSASINDHLPPLALLVVLRLLVGLHVNGLLMVASTVLSAGLALYVIDHFLALTQQRELVAHYERIYARPISEIDVDLSRENSADWTWGHPVVYNDLGFRSDNVLIPKPPGTRRVMVLGDSLTWGAGLAADERYTELLEAGLRQRWPATRWEVVNFGLSGGPTVTEARILAEHIDRVQPDFVIVGFCANDPQPLSQNYSVERTRFYPLHNLIASLRYAGLRHVQGLLHNRIDTALEHLGLIPSSIAALDRAYQVDSSDWQAWLAALHDIRRLTGDAGASPPIFALLSQGLAADRPHHPYLSRWFDQAGAAADAAGFVVVDPRPDFVANLTLADLDVNPSDEHPSIAANALYAAALLDAIDTMLLADGTPAADQAQRVPFNTGSAE